jgi:AMP-polyphosphate phosphotransferase
MPKTNKQIEQLRDELLTAQAQLTRDKSFALAIVVTGMPTAGRSEVVNQFLEWLDAKHIKVHAMNEWQQDTPCVPAMKRYWLALPARGEIAIYFMGWYEDYLAPALHPSKRERVDERRVVARIRQFESMLHADRVRVLKMDLRVDRKTQQERIEALRAEKATRWRVTKEDKWLAKHYGQVRKTMDRLIKATNSSAAPWHVVDGTDPERRMTTAGSLVLKELESGIRGEFHALAASASSRARKTSNAKVQEKAELLPTTAPKPDDETYERELEALQGRLALLTRKDAFGKRCVALAFEGLDAAGKGGTIRRVTAALDARQYTVLPVSAPTPEEFARPYLWRFWRNLPERGEFAIFDRSWYGRVLVERVRDLAEDQDWQRAYDEINEFELQLAEARIIVHKFWLSIGKDEQLKRLNDREEEQLKRFKVDKEDWANRRFFDAYQVAASEMIARTNTIHAPWTVVEADNKKYARLKVLGAVCDALESALTKPS